MATIDVDVNVMEDFGGYEDGEEVF